MQNQFVRTQCREQECQGKRPPAHPSDEDRNEIIEIGQQAEGMKPEAHTRSGFLDLGHFVRDQEKGCQDKKDDGTRSRRALKVEDGISAEEPAVKEVDGLGS